MLAAADMMTSHAISTYGGVHRRVIYVHEYDGKMCERSENEISKNINKTCQRIDDRASFHERDTRLDFLFASIHFCATRQSIINNNIPNDHRSQIFEWLGT